jgi:hypothetical protein
VASATSRIRGIVSINDGLMSCVGHALDSLVTIPFWSRSRASHDRRRAAGRIILSLVDFWSGRVLNNKELDVKY